MWRLIDIPITENLLLSANDIGLADAVCSFYGRIKEETNMKQIWNGIQFAFAALRRLSAVGFSAAVDGFLYALIAFVVIDYITGVLCAIADKIPVVQRGRLQGYLPEGADFHPCWASETFWMSIVLGRRQAPFCERRSFSSIISNEGVSAYWKTPRTWVCLIPEKLKEVLEQLHDRATDEKGGEE